MYQCLRDAHDQLLDLITKLEIETSKPLPDRAGLATVRWQLSRASGARRKMLEDQIYPALLATTHAAGLRRIQTLRDAAAAIRSASTHHISSWTMEAILADWPGYCAASQVMRTDMRARIALEREILYPLLEGVRG
jgi:hypothetical protein